ncbi:MAG TPA: TetR family transcriptional regulator C-terminal domain-containing protein [Acidimicrobiia bacterium]|jgi:AcrR family transcriptional regulator
MTAPAAVGAVGLESDLPPKQERLVRAAYREISERGAHRVSLQDIADRAGVSKAVILYYFGSRDRLLLETTRWVLSRTEARIRAAIVGVTDPRRRLLAVIDELFSAPDVNRRFYLVYLDLLDHAARDPRFGELHATFRSIVDALYEEVIAGGAAVGAFSAYDPTEAAEVMRAIIDGLFMQWLQEPHWHDTHHGYRERCKRAVMRYLQVATEEDGT